MNFPRTPRVPRVRIGRPQRLAAMLLLIFLGECLYVIDRQPLTTADYRFARCGREMWERPSALAGYFTTCGNLQGDGLFAYRLAGLPLVVQRLILLGTDHLRRPENRLYPGDTLNGSTYELRHQLSFVKYLIHLPFVGFALWLGGGLWWVARRLFGNEGGALALALYVFCPIVVRFSVIPNNEVLAMWGLYGLVYTGIGVAHAMHGPRRKWKPRIALLTVALGLTAAAHLLAAILGFTASLILMFYLAERRRSAVLVILTYAAVGAIFVEFTFFSFRLFPFLYIFTGGAARFWFSTTGPAVFLLNRANGPIVIAASIALFLYAAVPRSRYFGNSTPLLVFLAAACLLTTQTPTSPLAWALPFLFTFTGGVFADALETPHRKLFLTTVGLLVASQAVACLTVLSSLARA